MNAPIEREAAPVTLNAAEPFDLADFADVPSAPVVIKNPQTGAPTNITVELAGPEHPLRKKAKFDRSRRVRAGVMKTGKLQLDDPLDEEREEIEELVDWTLGWKNVTFNGQVVEFSKEAVRQLYNDPKRVWFRDQVKAAIAEREAFIQRSASN